MHREASPEGEYLVEQQLLSGETLFQQGYPAREIYIILKVPPDSVPLPCPFSVPVGR